MSQLRQRIRLAVDITEQGSLFDLISQSVPTIPRNTDVQFELGFFNNGVLLDITQWSAVTINGTPKSDTATAPVISETAGVNSVLPEGGSCWNVGLTLAQWQAGTAQHVTVIAPASDTDIYMDSVLDYFQFTIQVSSAVAGEIVPVGQHYSGGLFMVTVPAGTYTYTPSTNDASLVYGSGPTTITITTTFTLASPTQVTFNASGGHTSDPITATLVNSYAPNQQAGYGQVIFIDTGIGQIPPPSVITPTYLTVAMGDARYVPAVNLTTLQNNQTTFAGNFTTLGTLVNLNTLAPLASPTFTGTVTLAALKLPAGTLLTSPASGVIEYDGTSLYYTDSSNARQQMVTALSPTVNNQIKIAPIIGSNLIGNGLTLNSTTYLGSGSGPFVVTVSGLVTGAVYYWVKNGALPITGADSTITSGSVTVSGSSGYFTAAATTATMNGTASGGLVGAIIQLAPVTFANSFANRSSNQPANTATPTVTWLQVLIGGVAYYLPLYQ